MYVYIYIYTYTYIEYIDTHTHISINMGLLRAHHKDKNVLGKTRNDIKYQEDIN
jgi:hypothetical protein